VRKTLQSILESEIQPCTDHAEVVVRSIYKVPAEITDQANVWREADFHAAADLADCPRLAVSMTNGLELVETFAGFRHSPIHPFLTATKIPPPPPNMYGENRVQGIG
jgi:hypothetical protein